MKKKVLAWGYIVSIVLLFAAIITSAVYYLIINPAHEGEMEPWAKMLLFSSAGVFLILHIIIYRLGIKLSDVTSSKKAERLIDSVSRVLGWIVVIPIAIVAVVIATPFYIIFGGEKRTFKPLIAEGYKFTRDRRERCYLLSAENVRIKVDYSMTEWLVSINGGEFVPVVDSCLGTEYERAELRRLLAEYDSAHPVDKQRGDAKPPKEKFVEFLRVNLAHK